MSPRAKALSVHLFTATGAALAMLALLAAATANWGAMVLWLLAALVVDGIDGPLARRYHVRTHAPQIDGVLLDLIIDFLTYVFIPAFALYGSGLLPSPWGALAALLICVSAALYFSDTRMKMQDNAFRGFPGCWNMAVLTLLALAPPPWITLAACAALAAAQFLPLKFIHPVRTARWRPLSLPAAALWTALAAWAAATGFAQPAWASWALGLSTGYLLLAGIAQQLLAPR